MDKEIVMNEEKTARKEKDSPQQCLLLNYLYSGKDEILEKAGEISELEKWDKWHCAILLETNQSFFDKVSDTLPKEIERELRRSFHYVNLNARQSLLLFADKTCDYALVAKRIYVVMKQKYSARFYLAVSRTFDGYRALPGILEQLEQQMEGRFYHEEIRIFTCEDAEEASAKEETEDYRLMEKISEDISRRDVEQLWKHFECMAEKYRKSQNLSSMYVKFVFSNVLQELYQDEGFSEQGHLNAQIDRLYGGADISRIIGITEENIRDYEAFQERMMKNAEDKVENARNYIRLHCEEELSAEFLAEKVKLSPGYFSFVFRKKTGMSLNRYIYGVRMGN